METGDPGAAGAPPGQGGGPSPPGWNPQPPPPPAGWPPPPPPGGWTPPPSPPPPPPGGAWPPPPPPPPAQPGSPTGWNPVPPGYPPNAAAGAYWGGPSTGSGRFRTRGVGELLDGAFTLYRRNFLLLVAIAAVVQVPFALLQLVVYELADIGGRLSGLQDLSRTITNQGGSLTTDQTSQLVGDLGAFVAFIGVTFILQYLVVFPLSEAATTSAVSARYLDQPATVGSSYRAALGRLRSLVALVLWLTLIVGGAFALAVLLTFLTGAPAVLLVLGLPVLLLYVVLVVRTTVSPQAIVLERLTGRQGIRRSFSLTQGSSGRIVGLRLVLGLIQTVVAGVLTLPVTALVGATSLGTQQLVGEAAQAVVAVFVAPITLVALTLLYYDLRIRREGFDIEMLAASL